MPKIDVAAVAVNAAGIADALRCLQTDNDANTSRFERLTEEYEGWVGVLTQVADAAELMEHFRIKQGATSVWGGDLPYLYEIWDAIALAMLNRLGAEPLDRLVTEAIEAGM